MAWRRQSILSAQQFTPQDLGEILELSRLLEERLRKTRNLKLLDDYVLATLFFEPSTRTRLSFEAAMHRLGGRVISTVGVQFSSLAKGETLFDTLKMVESYSDVCAIRHSVEGASTLAARSIKIPVINAGDGAGEHPTQALLDLFTIRDELGKLDGLHVAMVGDLRFGRTVHSLTQLLAEYKVKLSFVSPEILRLPLDLMNEVRGRGLDVQETYNVADVIGEVDVLYVTRVQKERFSDLAQYEEVKGYYVIDEAIMAAARRDMIVLHPLPRVGEIDPRVDKDPRAAYFRQVQNGMFLRMALLAGVMGKA